VPGRTYRNVGIPNYVEHCVSAAEQRRFIFSNGVPDHEIAYEQHGRSQPCAQRYSVSMPLNPAYLSRITEIPTDGPVAFALNGVPIYSAVWAVHNRHLYERKAWMGHPGTFTNKWHYHHSGFADHGGYPSHDTLVGYALDGFPIFGPGSNRFTEQLDECNGRFVQGSYRYHLRKKSQVDFDHTPYCTGAANNWNLVLGCYHGSVLSSRISRDTMDRHGLQCGSPEAMQVVVASPPPPSPRPPSFASKDGPGGPLLWTPASPSRQGPCRTEKLDTDGPHNAPDESRSAAAVKLARKQRGRMLQQFTMGTVAMPSSHAMHSTYKTAILYTHMCMCWCICAIEPFWGDHPQVLGIK